jgi:hypothetical protein
MQMERQSVLERLERLERQNRVLKGAGLLLVLGICGACLLGPAGGDGIIEATAFVLLDESGNELARLGGLSPERRAPADSTGVGESWGLMLADGRGGTAAVLGMQRNGPVLSLEGEEDQTAHLSSNGIAILGGGGAGIGVHVQGEWPVLRFSKETANSHITMGLLGSSGPEPYAGSLCAVCAEPAPGASSEGQRGVLVIAASSAADAEEKAHE